MIVKELMFRKVNGGCRGEHVWVPNDLETLPRGCPYASQVARDLASAGTMISDRGVVDAEVNDGDHYCWEGCGLECRYRVS